MYNYDPKSLKAEEFINHEEIEETLRYAEENKHNAELIDSILEKAKLRKGLSHREAEVLLDCDIPEKNEEIYKLAEQIKKDFYGNRIVMFAPLYLSNYCVNGCLYCPYHAKNKHICRKKLTQDEVRQEVIALQDMGHKRLAIEAGEDPVNNPLQDYLLNQAQERRYPQSKRKHCRYDGRRLQKAERGGHRHIYSVPGNLSQGEL